MIVYFADGPLNGQRREVPASTWRWRVPIMNPTSVDYWEASEALLLKANIRVGYYEVTACSLFTDESIFIFKGIER
jgi:hypothetical protein